MSNLCVVSDANFKSEVLQSNRPTLVDFWAPWCGPCQMLGPVIEELASERGDSAKIAKVNVDESPNVAAAYGVDSIPTVMVFQRGEVVARLVGLRPKADFVSALDRAAA